MKTRYLIFFLIFLFLAALFSFFRSPIAEWINTFLIAVGEGRSIRIDNTNMVKRKTEKQVKVKGGARISAAAQVKVFPGKLDSPPVNRIKEGKHSRKRKALFIPEWAFLGRYDLSVISKNMNLPTVLKQECMNGDSSEVSFQMVPKGFEWKKVQILSNDGRINLAEIFRRNKIPSAAWLVTDIELEKDYPDARMLVGIQQFGRVFLNGREVFTSTAKTPVRSDGSNVPVQLKKGRNRIIVKTASGNARNWFVFLRFTTAGKIPLMLPVPAPKADGVSTAGNASAAKKHPPKKTVSEKTGKPPRQESK